MSKQGAANASKQSKTGKRADSWISKATGENRVREAVVDGEMRCRENQNRVNKTSACQALVSAGQKSFIISPPPRCFDVCSFLFLSLPLSTRSVDVAYDLPRFSLCVWSYLSSCFSA